MASRSVGPDYPKPIWTAKRVRLSMVGGWREGRRPAFMGKASSARSALDWASMFLPAEHPMTDRARTYLLTSVMLEAEGRSFREFCDESGWKRSTVLRWIAWATDHIVESLNDAARMQDNR